MEIFILLSFLLLAISSDRALGQFSIKPAYTCPKTTRTAFVRILPSLIDTYADALSQELTHHLMNKYYNWTSGRLNGGSVWTDAVSIFATCN